MLDEKILTASGQSVNLIRLCKKHYVRT